MARRGPLDPDGGRGEDLQGDQGEGRPPGVPEDLLGAARPRPRDARERVPGRVPAGTRDRRHQVQDRGAGRVEHRLRPYLHPAGQTGRGAGGGDQQPRPAGPADLDLPRPPRPDVPGWQGRDRIRRRLPRAGRLSGAARPHRGGEGPAAQHRLPDGQGRAPREARGHAPAGHRGARPPQAAAPGLPDRAPDGLPQGLGRWDGAPRPGARRGGRPRHGAERRREDRERVGRGQRGGRRREGSGLDRADDGRRRWARTGPSWPRSSWA